MLEEAVVVAHDEEGLHLAQRVERDADDDEERGAAEEAGHLPREAQVDAEQRRENRDDDEADRADERDAGHRVIEVFGGGAAGADAVLLIAAESSMGECRQLIDKAHALGLEVLLEMHSEQELAYAALEPDLYGINNRNLGTFFTDVENSFRLAEKLPKDVCRVSESGISNPQTVLRLREEGGFRGFLMGEQFMKQADPGVALQEFIKQLKQYRKC